jgi:hypothetical protein
MKCPACGTTGRVEANSEENAYEIQAQKHTHGTTSLLSLNDW